LSLKKIASANLFSTLRPIGFVTDYRLQVVWIILYSLKNTANFL